MTRRQTVPTCRRTAVTLTELMIATVVLSLFLGGIFYLVRGGQNAGSQAFWLQKTIAGLRNTTRHISQTVQRSSYPSTIVFPDDIVENESPDFEIKYITSLYATESAVVAGLNTPGTVFLRFVESTPERIGGSNPGQGLLHFHVYSLTSTGRLLYHKYDQPIPPTAAPLYVSTISQSSIPGGAAIVRSEILTDVESIFISASNPEARKSSIEVTITCAYPRGHTRRSEKALVVGNVLATSGNP